MPVPGTAFGRYLVESRHAFQAAGFVVDVREERTGARRQLWLLTPSVVADPQLRVELVGTATAVRRLRSDHLVTLHEFGEIDGQPFFARDVAEGTTLAQRGTLAGDVAGALECMAQIGHGLHVLHTAGVVDGALGPGRVEISGGPGQRRARLRDGGVLGVLVARGVVVGPGWEEALDYRAPEVHAGRPVDARSDIYSLGGLLWTALTGRTPFDTYVGHQLDPVPQLAGTTPAVMAVNEILQRSLSKEPFLRYHKALDMVDALRLVPGVADLRVEVAERAPSVARESAAAAVVAIAVGAGAGPDEVAAPADVPLPADASAAGEMEHPDASSHESPDPSPDLVGDDGEAEGGRTSRSDLLGPPSVGLIMVVLLGLLLLAAIWAVRHFDLVPEATPSPTGTTSIVVVGLQSGGVRAIA